jgi:hypothetical protein
VQRTYSTEVSPFFNLIPKHNDAFVSPWQEFNNSVMGEIWLLHSQPFTNSHFHFLMIVERAKNGTNASMCSDMLKSNDTSGE